MTKIIAGLVSATTMLFLVTACAVAPQQRQAPLGQYIGGESSISKAKDHQDNLCSQS